MKAATLATAVLIAVIARPVYAAPGRVELEQAAVPALRPSAAELSRAPAPAAAPAAPAVFDSEPSAAQRVETAERRVESELGYPRIVGADDLGIIPPPELSRAAADLLEIDLPFLREAEAGLNLGDSGAVAIEESGFPENGSYFAVSRAAALLAQPAATALGAAERALLERLGAVHAKTQALLFSGKNAAAKTTRYAEPSPGGLALTILEYVRSERFKVPLRWVWSSQRAKEAREGWARITAETARSPFLKELGRGASTTIYWAAKAGGELGEPDPLGMRVRVNSDASGSERSMEIFAPDGVDDDGEVRWQAFFFKKLAGEWVPGVREKLHPSQRCIACHYRIGADGKPRLHPVPATLRTKAAFIAVGYRDTRLLAQYLSGLR